jgi:hypothetical protein
MLMGSIVALFLAAILFVGFFIPPSLAMAQLQQQQTTTTTTGTVVAPPPPTTPLTPSLTPEEQEQQNRLQNVIAATTRDLNETEKQVSGVVFTPRWSEPMWVNANSIAVLIAYCLPGEFADSGQEILGGFELEVLESYAVDLPQGFMAWMAVVGNEDVQNRRFPAALGVICASDLNQTDSRILSLQEQQVINNVISQFTTIQNTQITNIDQVINIINNATTTTTPPAQNETGGGGGTEPTTEEQPLRVEAIVNVTEAFAPVWVMFDAKVSGGTPPYHYSWWGFASEIEDKSFTQLFDQPDPFTFVVTVIDSKGQAAVDSVQIVINRPPTNGTEPTTEEQSLRAEIITNATQVYTGSTIKFDASIRGGAPPYSYSWSSDLGLIDQDRSITLNFFEPGTFTYGLTATDSNGQTASDSIQITVEERPGGVLLPPETGEEGQPLGGGLLPRTPPPPPPPNDNEVISPPEGGGEEPPTTEEGEEPSPPPPSDDTEEGEGTPPSSTTEEEPTTPPEGGG